MKKILFLPILTALYFLGCRPEHRAPAAGSTLISLRAGLTTWNPYGSDPVPAKPDRAHDSAMLVYQLQFSDSVLSIGFIEDPSCLGRFTGHAGAASYDRLNGENVRTEYIYLGAIGCGTFVTQTFVEKS